MMIDIDKLGSVPTSENEYVAGDGLLHCKKCGEPVEVAINPKGIGKIKVRCICRCVQRERELAAKKAKQEEYNRNRRLCFGTSYFKTCTFDASDETEYLNMAKNYVDHFRDFKKMNKGLLLYGSVGTGKSHMAACIANALIDDGCKVLMTNFATMVNILQSSFEGRQDYIDSLNRYELLIIDDLGAERKSEYMQEQVFNIIDARCKSGLPMIITTNLTMIQLTDPSEIGAARIYDRVLERCHPIALSGSSRRISNARADYKRTKMLLKGEIEHESKGVPSPAWQD